MGDIGRLARATRPRFTHSRSNGFTRMRGRADSRHSSVRTSGIDAPASRISRRARRSCSASTRVSGMTAPRSAWCAATVTCTTRCGESGRPRRGMRSRWARWSSSTKVKATPHTLRHSLASLLFEQGHTAAQVAAWLGHQDPSFTLRVYVHARDAGDAEFLDEALGGDWRARQQ